MRSKSRSPEPRGARVVEFKPRSQESQDANPGNPEQDRARPLPPSAQDANWDEDATSYFTRDADGVLQTRRENVNAGGPVHDSTSDWEEEQVTAHFSRVRELDTALPGLIDLSELLEPEGGQSPYNDNVGQPRHWAERDVAASRTAVEPQWPALDAQLASPSFAPELRAGVEASPRASLRPGRSPWSWSLATSVPILCLLFAYAYWVERAERAVQGSERSVHAAAAPIAVAPIPSAVAREPAEPEVVAAAQVVTPVGAAPAVPSRVESRVEEQVVGVRNPDAELAIAKAPPTEVAVVKAPPARKHARRSAQHTRRIMQLSESSARDDSEGEHTPARNTGVLQVNSRPWARVLIDDQFVGHTPQRALRLPAGKHRVRLVNHQFAMSKSFEVSIEAGHTIKRVELLEDDATASR